MQDRYPNPVGLAALDDMIARAEALCERYRSMAKVRQPGMRWSATRLRAQQQRMEDTLARLRAQGSR